MDAIATQKFLRASPQKLREVVAMIKDMKPTQAIEILPFVGKRGAEPILKVIKSAMANASLKGMATADIVFKEIQIGEGPSLKRGIAVSRGRYHPILKKMAHIRVVVGTVEAKKEEVKIETKKAVKAKGKESRGTKN